MFPVQIAVKAVHIRPDPKLKRQECCLKVSILPLRLNIDQDALLFLIGFFNELGTADVQEEVEPILGPASKHGTPTHQPPIMTVSVREEEPPLDEHRKLEEARKLVDENLLILFEKEDPSDDAPKPEKLPDCTGNDSAPIYFRFEQFFISHFTSNTYSYTPVF